MDQTDKTYSAEVLDFFAESAKKTSRAESVVEVILQGITRGYWKTGDRINDLELSTQLGVSRLTVREALSKLVERNLLEKKHWKGYTIRKLSWVEVDGLIDVRLVLEELALRKAVGKMSPEMKEELAAAIEAARIALEANDFVKFFALDYRFHEIFYNCSENVWLSKLLGDLRLLINIVRRISQVDNNREVAKTSIREHERILQDIRSSQWEAAVEHLREHLNNHRERVRKEYSTHNLGD